MKKLLIGASILIAIVAIGVVLVLNNLDGLIKGTIETVGSTVLGVKVSVENVSIKLKDGSGEIKGLKIENPKGYTSKYAFEMETVRLGINLQSLGKSPIILNEIIVDSPIAILEIKDLKTNNLKAILNNIVPDSEPEEEKSQPEPAKETEEPKEEPKEESKEEPKEESKGEATLVSVKKIFINGVTFKIIDSRKEDQEKTKSGTIATIEINDLGGDTGITPAYLCERVMDRLSNEILKESLSGSIKKDLFGGLKGKLKK